MTENKSRMIEMCIDFRNLHSCNNIALLCMDPRHTLIPLYKADFSFFQYNLIFPARKDDKPFSFS